MKEKSTADEMVRLKKLLESKPQAFQKRKFYENLLTENENVYLAIQKRIKRGYVLVNNMVLGFIPVYSKHKLDELDKSRLELELIDIENTTWNQKQYYDAWVKRCLDIEKETDKITRECNDNFEKTLAEAKEIQKNIILQQIISNYKNESNDQQIKNEFYLVLKQHINNSKVYNSRR